MKNEKLYEYIICLICEIENDDSFALYLFKIF